MPDKIAWGNEKLPGKETLGAGATRISELAAPVIFPCGTGFVVSHGLRLNETPQAAWLGASLEKFALNQKRVRRSREHC